MGIFKVKRNESCTVSNHVINFEKKVVNYIPGTLLKRKESQKLNLVIGECDCDDYFLVIEEEQDIPQWHDIKTEYEIVGQSTEYKIYDVYKNAGLTNLVQPSDYFPIPGASALSPIPTSPMS